MQSPAPKFSTTLPKDVREALIAAAKVPNERQRMLAIEEAIKRARRRYPQFFNLNEGVTA